MAENKKNTQLFSADSITTKGGVKRPFKATLTIGNGKPDIYAMFAEAGGRQIFRTQYDIAVDGTEYVLTAGAGQGNFEFYILDGPYDGSTPVEDCGGGKDSFASRYGKMKDFSQRKIEIVVPLSAPNQSRGTRSTQGNAQFKGMIISADTALKMSNDGTYQIITRVSAVGTWS